MCYVYQDCFWRVIRNQAVLRSNNVPRSADYHYSGLAAISCGLCCWVFFQVGKSLVLFSSERGQMCTARFSGQGLCECTLRASIVHVTHCSLVCTLRFIAGDQRGRGELMKKQDRTAQTMGPSQRGRPTFHIWSVALAHACFDCGNMYYHSCQTSLRHLLSCSCMLSAATSGSNLFDFLSRLLRNVCKICSRRAAPCPVCNTQTR